MKRAHESEEEEEEDFSEGPPVPEAVAFAPAPTVPAHKKQRVDDYDHKESQRRELIRQLKILRINHPTLKVGLTAALDNELNGMSDDQLETLLQNYHLELTGAKPFPTGYAMCTGLGRAVEHLLGLEGFVQRVTKDSELVANMDTTLPFRLEHPLAKSVLSIGIHILNAIAESNRWQPPLMKTPEASSSTPPDGSS